MKRIIICGPESTGKTTLAKYLANFYNSSWVAEYAREYVCKLNRKYNYSDIELIAKKQIKQYKSVEEKSELIFFDTGLIITKIWFLELYGKCPEWLEEELGSYKPDVYLLCYPDLNWEFDPLRENGQQEQRLYLYTIYLKEIKKTGCNYQIIRGFNQERYKLAIQTIDKFIKDVEK